MPRPWKLLDRVDTPQGPLELRQRGERDFMISIAGRVLMSSIIHHSETQIAELGCAPIRQRAGARVLVGGLGLGFTLRAALDALPRTAQVTIAELNPVVVAWCRGPLAVLTDHVLDDPRVEVYVGDVSTCIESAATASQRGRFDAIILDLYIGPSRGRDAAHDPLYGRAILERTYAALRSGGVYAVWGEDPDASFEQRLGNAGFRTEVIRSHAGGPRHVLYLGTKSA